MITFFQPFSTEYKLFWSIFFLKLKKIYFDEKMNVNWKNWCRFCANAGKTIKLEPSRDLEYIFKVNTARNMEN